MAERRDGHVLGAGASILAAVVAGRYHDVRAV
jgi:hypothetical protein